LQSVKQAYAASQVLMDSLNNDPSGQAFEQLKVPVLSKLSESMGFEINPANATPESIEELRTNALVDLRSMMSSQEAEAFTGFGREPEESNILGFDVPSGTPGSIVEHIYGQRNPDYAESQRQNQQTTKLLQLYNAQKAQNDAMGLPTEPLSVFIADYEAASATRRASGAADAKSENAETERLRKNRRVMRGLSYTLQAYNDAVDQAQSMESRGKDDPSFIESMQTANGLRLQLLNQLKKISRGPGEGPMTDRDAQDYLDQIGGIFTLRDARKRQSEVMLNTLRMDSNMPLIGEELQQKNEIESGYEIGQIINGYRYLGGDPTSYDSYEKVED